jgi:hypothetical protein
MRELIQMNQNMIAALARQHTAELYNHTATSHRPHKDRAHRPSLRERTGWTMVDLGLRLVAQPGPGLAHRPAGS